MDVHKESISLAVRNDGREARDGMRDRAKSERHLDFIHGLREVAGTVKKEPGRPECTRC